MYLAGLGPEHPECPSGITTPCKSGGAKSHANLSMTAPMTQELAVMAGYWPHLPDSVRCGILAMVKAGTTEAK